MEKEEVSGLNFQWLQLILPISCYASRERRDSIILKYAPKYDKYMHLQTVYS